MKCDFILKSMVIFHGLRSYCCSRIYSQAPNLEKLCHKQRVKLPFTNRNYELLEVKDVDVFIDNAIEFNLPEPYGLVTWSSSFSAVNLLDKCFGNSVKLRGKTVCDVGCGTGLTSIVLESFGASVIALDHNDISLQITQLNSELNRRSNLNGDNISSYGSIQYLKFDLETDQLLPFADLYIFSDVLYFDSLAKCCARRASEIIRKGSQFILTDPGRSTRYVFLKALEFDLGKETYFAFNVNTNISESKWIPIVNGHLNFENIDNIYSNDKVLLHDKVYIWLGKLNEC